MNTRVRRHGHGHGRPCPRIFYRYGRDRVQIERPRGVDADGRDRLRGRRYAGYGNGCYWSAWEAKRLALVSARCCSPGAMAKTLSSHLKQWTGLQNRIFCYKAPDLRGFHAGVEPVPQHFYAGGKRSRTDRLATRRRSGLRFRKRSLTCVNGTGCASAPLPGILKSACKTATSKKQSSFTSNYQARDIR